MTTMVTPRTFGLYKLLRRCRRASLHFVNLVEARTLRQCNSLSNQADPPLASEFPPGQNGVLGMSLATGVDAPRYASIVDQKRIELMTRTKEILRGLARLLSCDARATRIRTPRTPALSWAALEGRIVPSSFGGGFAEVASFGQGHGRGPQRGGGSPGGFGGSGGSGSGGGETSSAIGQDARAVQQDYQTFESAYESAVAALRLTATATTGPSADGLTAFNAAIATAIGTLNTSIGSDLSHLTTTGSAVSATIEASNATLETEIESAATGLANSTNSAVLALNRETRSYLRDAQGAATSAILGDSATGSLSSAVIKTFNQAVGTASQTFRSSIHSAVQTSISAGTAPFQLGADVGGVHA